MEAGALRIEKRPCDLRDVVGASLGELRDELGKRAVRVAIPREFPDVPMDFRFMMKALCNVIDNAVKYSGPETPLDVGARLEGGVVRIEIADAGSGIPPGDLRRVFDKFYRVERPGRVTGAGLGLSISKGIVEAHGGTIEARNNDGGGATIAISIPLGTGTP
jgi:two-component system sensor histidine kinase KdpD